MFKFIKKNRSLLTDYEFPLRRNPDYLNDEKSAFFQVVKTNHFANKCWLRYLSSNSVNMSQLAKTFKYIIDSNMRAIVCVTHFRYCGKVHIFPFNFTILFYCLNWILVLWFSVGIDLKLSYDGTCVIYQGMVLHICLMEKQISFSQWRICGKSILNEINHHPSFVTSKTV